MSEHKTPLSWIDKIAMALTGEPKDLEELIAILHDAAERSLIDANSLEMLEGVIDVQKLKVTDVMVPRSQMVVLEKDMSLANILSIVTTSGHSRFPVIGDNKDEVIGILLAKDLLQYAINSAETFDIKDVLRKATFVPESKRLNVLLHDFRASKNHMAIVVDEYGNITGLATIEDVLEQIVGDIVDEHDLNESVMIKQIATNSYYVKALTSIEDFNDFFDTKISEPEIDTIGGLVTKSFGRLPKNNETTQVADFSFKVIKANSRKLELLLAKPLSK